MLVRFFSAALMAVAVPSAWAAYALVWRNLLTADRPGREAMMDQEERHTLNGLPTELTVYRGVGHSGVREGFSWTLDRQRAEWFARRAAMVPARAEVVEPVELEPQLVAGTVDRSDVIAYLDGREEQEIVALPEHVRVEGIELLH
jgi:hypothetical protein